MPQRQGPLPVSRNGRLPGVGWGQKAFQSPFSRWLKLSRVRAQHRGKPLTQKKLEDLLGWSSNRVSKLESGHFLPNLNELEELSLYFNVTTDELYTKIYQIPPDMHLFLTTTKEGEAMVRNIRSLMKKIGEGTLKDQLPANLQEYAPYMSYDDENQDTSSTGRKRQDFEFYAAKARAEEEMRVARGESIPT